MARLGCSKQDWAIEIDPLLPTIRFIAFRGVVQDLCETRAQLTYNHRLEWVGYLFKAQEYR
jgi:hypothetical protein